MMGYFKLNLAFFLYSAIIGGAKSPLSRALFVGVDTGLPESVETWALHAKSPMKKRDANNIVTDSAVSNVEGFKMRRVFDTSSKEESKVAEDTGANLMLKVLKNGHLMSVLGEGDTKGVSILEMRATVIQPLGPEKTKNTAILDKF